MNHHLCHHCGLEVIPGLEVTDSAACGLVFCCRGCLGAYLLISGAGLDDFYRRRDAAPGVQPASAAFSDDRLLPFVRQEGDDAVMDILIDGIRCAACAWLNEKILAQLPGVRQVRVHYTTGKGTIRFDAATASPASIFQRIAQLGYGPKPYTPSAAEQAVAVHFRDLLVRLGVAVFFTMQLMAFSFALYAGYLQGISPFMKEVMQYFSLAVATPVVFYSGWPFLKGALRDIRNGATGMDLLVTTGSLASWIYSVGAMFTGDEVYFETAAMIVTLILVGRLLEVAARRKTAAGIERLLALAPQEATRVTDAGVEVVSADALRPGDVVVVAEGNRVAADGVVVEGSAELDESAVTGEPYPVARREGDAVVAGTLNVRGTVKVLVERPSTDSFIARVARMVDDALSRRAPVQELADRAAAWFVPAVLLVAAIVFIISAGSAAADALMRCLAVILIACPCALGLATPAAMTAGCGAAAAAGIVFRGGDVLQRLASVNVLACDKTGTVSAGRPAVTAIAPAGVTEGELLKLAASVEAGANHPLAHGILRKAAEEGVTVAQACNVVTTAGGGMEGDAGRVRVVAGTARFLAQKGIHVAAPEPFGAASGSIVHVAADGSYCGALLLTDVIRPEASAALRYFAKHRFMTLLLSGDREQTVAETASFAGFATYASSLLPEEKASRLTQLQADGKRVLMVGDGINDAPSLSTATVGCAVNGGTELAAEAADMLLTRSDLMLLPFAHEVAARTMRVVRMNLFWAFLYNIVGVPLAITGQLTPIYAAAAMAASSLMVVLNSLRLTRLKPWNNRS